MKVFFLKKSMVMLLPMGNVSTCVASEIQSITTQSTSGPLESAACQRLPWLGNIPKLYSTRFEGCTFFLKCPELYTTTLEQLLRSACIANFRFDDIRVRCTVLENAHYQSHNRIGVA
jgi:hypothetical protein